MLGIAFQIGISVDQFWDMTYRELNICIQAYLEKQKRDQELQITTAYLTAYWQRVKRMPSLSEVLGHKKKRKQTPEDMLKEIKRINEAMGGTVT